MEKKIWCCLVEGTSGGFHHRHFTLEEATTEAARLAKLPGNEGKKVYIMEATQYCVTEYPPIVWHNVEEVTFPTGSPIKITYVNPELDYGGS